MGLFVIPESLPFTIAFAISSGIFLTLATGATHFPSHIDRMVDKELEAKETLHAEQASAGNEDDKQPTKVSKKMWRVVRQNVQC